MRVSERERERERGQDKPQYYWWWGCPLRVSGGVPRGEGKGGPCISKACCDLRRSVILTLTVLRTSRVLGEKFSDQHQLYVLCVVTTSVNCQTFISESCCVVLVTFWTKH